MNLILLGDENFKYQGEYYSFEHIKFHLWDIIKLEKITVRTIMEVLSCNIDFYSVVLGSPFLPDLITSYQKIKNNNRIETDNDISMAVCSRCAETQEIKENKELFINSEFSGKSESTEDLSFSFTFTGIEKIINLPLSINEEFIIIDWIKERKKEPKIEDIQSKLGNCEFTVIELLRCIVYELTFAGTEEDKKEKCEMLKKRLEKAEEDIEAGNTSSFSDIHSFIKKIRNGDVI